MKKFFIVDNGKQDLIVSMNDYLKNAGIDTGYAGRLMVGGEWGLAFQEIYYAAKSSPEHFESLKDQIDTMNAFFCGDPYLKKHCGFPLS